MNIRILNFLKKIYLIFILIPAFPYFRTLELYSANNNEEIYINKNQISNINKNRYLLGPGDTLSINFIDVEDFSGDYIIMPDGTINLPLVGVVEADYISIKTLTDKLIKLYSEELIRPDFFISLKERRDIRVSIIGEINKPGIFNLTRESPDSPNSLKNNLNNFPTIVDAISKAGGITPKSDISSLEIERLVEGQISKYKKTQINLIDLLMKGDQSQNLILFDGDIIKIPEVNENKIFSNKVLKIAKGNLSPKSISINVIGAVDKPGEYNVKPNTSLMKAILLANGLSPWEANKSNVQLLRINRNGSVSVKKFRFNINEKISDKKNPTLLDGDVIKVNTSNFAKIRGGVKSVTEPFSDILSSYSLFKLISE